ncbi:MAG TPA: OmpH family outer membrane protein [Allosphingosinicella sp.]|nr:OmpH family outer membrane protein [Allosphingosinicella sp.]
MNKIAFGAALAALSVALPGAAQAQKTPPAVIVVVDSSRIYGECTACRAASAQLQSLVTSAQQRAQALGQPIQTEAQSIEQAANALQNQPAGAGRTTAQTALQNRINALQTRQNSANQELQRLEQNIQSTRANVARQINERLNPIINQVMTAHGANLALDVDATLAHSSGVDVTTEVLNALNQKLPSVSVTPLPQQPAQQQPQGR